MLPLHEIESVLCDQDVVTAVADHVGKDPAVLWGAFHDRVRAEYSGKTLNATIARHVHARVRDLLDGAFVGAQIQADLPATVANHTTALSSLTLPGKTEDMFQEEERRVVGAVTAGGKEMLAILPGKHLMSILADATGLGTSSELAELAIRSLQLRQGGDVSPIAALGRRVETALLKYLPPRRTSGIALPANDSLIPGRPPAPTTRGHGRSFQLTGRARP